MVGLWSYRVSKQKKGNSFMPIAFKHFTTENTAIIIPLVFTIITTAEATFLHQQSHSYTHIRCSYTGGDSRAANS